MRIRQGTAAVIAAAVALGLTACGGSGDDEARIARERAEAAQQARQEAKIEQLEDELRERTTERTTTTTRTVTTTPAPTPPPASGESKAGSASTGDWPGGSGYTAILASEGSESAARATQRAASAAGLDAGVLRSSDFRSLRPGYWVVFSGTFGSQADAARRASRAKSLGYGDAYPRFVSP
jgi:septal ring-binding cell division protein DamX